MTQEIEGDVSLALFERLRDLKVACGPKANKNDVAIVMIEACISEGLQTRRRIVGQLKAQGLDRCHVNIILDRETGGNPKRHRWELDHEGRYSLHSDER